MDERNVREAQQEGGAAGKPEASRPSARRPEGGSSFGRQDRPRPRVLEDGWPPLLTAGEVAVALRTSRKAVYAMVERAQLPGVTRIGRRLLVRRDDLLAWLDERRAASPGGTRR
jgi:excisionase family DNA binding protein